MPFLHLDGNAKAMYRWPPCQVRPTTSTASPSLWPRGRENWLSSHWVCLCKTRCFGLQVLSPPGDVSLDEWWCFCLWGHKWFAAARPQFSHYCRGLDFWIHQNHCVFDGFPQAWLLRLNACRRRVAALGHGWGAGALTVRVPLHLVIRSCLVMVVMLSSVSWDVKGYECLLLVFSLSLFFNTRIQLSCVFKTKKNCTSLHLETDFRSSYNLCITSNSLN